MYRHSVYFSCHPVDAVFVGQLTSIALRGATRGNVDIEIAPEVDAADVVVVLIGPHTDHHRRVCAEIEATLQGGPVGPRAGLLGVVLPTYAVAREVPRFQLRGTDEAAAQQYWPGDIPAALMRAVEGGLARLYRWPEQPEWLLGHIHDAAVDRLRAPLPPTAPAPELRPTL